MDIKILAMILSSGVISSVITLLGSRAIRRSELKKNEATAADLLSSTYNKLVSSLNEEIGRLKSINQEMIDQKERLISQIHDLENQVEGLRKEVDKLTKRLRVYEKNPEKTFNKDHSNVRRNQQRGGHPGRET